MWQSAATADSVWQDYSEKLRNSFCKLKRRLLQRHFFSSLSRGSKTLHLRRIVEFPKFQLCDHQNAAWSYLHSYQRSEDWNSHNPLLGLLIMLWRPSRNLQLCSLQLWMRCPCSSMELRQKKKKVIRNLQENSSLVTFNGSQRPALQNKSAYTRRYNSVNKWMQQM